MTVPAPPVRVLIASFLEPHLVDRIRSVDLRIAVTYRADLVGQPRYPGDHTAPMKRSPDQDAEWDRDRRRDDHHQDRDALPACAGSSSPAPASRHSFTP